MPDTNTPQTTPCRGCGKPILWGITAEGTKIPLDPTPPVYRRGEGLPPPGYVFVYRDRAAYCSHFSACKAASQFSRSNRKDNP